MEKEYRKWVGLVFVLVAIFTAWVVHLGLGQLAQVFDWEAQVPKIDLWIQSGSGLVGLIVWAALAFNQKGTVYMVQVFEEMAKVSWPSHQETLGLTWVVIVMVLVSGVLLGLLDYGWLIGLHTLLS